MNPLPKVVIIGDGPAGYTAALRLLGNGFTDITILEAKIGISRERRIGTFDPVLEKLREEVDGPPNTDIIISQIQRLTTRFHVAFLFERTGMALLQKLCLFMSSTASGKIYSGWQEFANELSLTREQIQCIEYDFKGLQDPTYYVLLAFAQSPDATIDKILIALKKISRLDIINRIINDIKFFVNDLNIEDNGENILRPSIIPRVPLVLRPIISIENNNFNDSEHVSKSSDNNSHEKTLNRIKQNSKESHYGSIVMLTFTKDGEKIANNIARLFRGKNPKIGVLILQEQEKQVYSKAEEFIDDCFKQVNYIIPILTNNYISNINGISGDVYNPSDNSLDAKYVKYIYSLLRYEYVRNKCCNNRVRCIVPDSEIKSVIKSDLHPTLQAWFRMADMNAFAENVLLKKF